MSDQKPLLDEGPPPGLDEGPPPGIASPSNTAKAENPRTAEFLQGASGNLATANNRGNTQPGFFQQVQELFRPVLDSFSRVEWCSCCLLLNIVIFIPLIALIYARPEEPEVWSHRCFSEAHGDNSLKKYNQSHRCFSEAHGDLSLEGCKEALHCGWNDKLEKGGCFQGIEVDVHFQNGTLWVKYDEWDPNTLTLEHLLSSLPTTPENAALARSAWQVTQAANAVKAAHPVHPVQAQIETAQATTAATRSTTLTGQGDSSNTGEQVHQVLAASSSLLAAENREVERDVEHNDPPQLLQIDILRSEGDNLPETGLTGDTTNSALRRESHTLTDTDPGSNSGSTDGASVVKSGNSNPSHTGTQIRRAQAVAQVEIGADGGQAQVEIADGAGVYRANHTLNRGQHPLSREMKGGNEVDEVDKLQDVEVKDVNELSSEAGAGSSSSSSRSGSWATVAASENADNPATSVIDLKSMKHLSAALTDKILEPLQGDLVTNATSGRHPTGWNGPDNSTLNSTEKTNSTQLGSPSVPSYLVDGTLMNVTANWSMWIDFKTSEAACASQEACYPHVLKKILTNHDMLNRTYVEVYNEEQLPAFHDEGIKVMKEGEDPSSDLTSTNLALLPLGEGFSAPREGAYMRNLPWSHTLRNTLAPPVNGECPQGQWQAGPLIWVSIWAFGVFLSWVLALVLYKRCVKPEVEAAWKQRATDGRTVGGKT